MKGKLVGAAGQERRAREGVQGRRSRARPRVVERGARRGDGPAEAAHVRRHRERARRRRAQATFPARRSRWCAIARARPFMETLASAQKIALFCCSGCIAAGVVFTLLVSQGGAAEEEEEEHRCRSQRPSPVPTPPRGGAEPKNERGREDGAAVAGTLAGACGGGRGEPRRLQLPAAADMPPMRRTPTALARASTFDGPAENPFAVGRLRRASRCRCRRVAPPPLSLADDDYENQRTTAYPAHRCRRWTRRPTRTARSTRSRWRGGPGRDPRAEFNPDATRVAAIPPELLKSARRDCGGTTAANPASQAAPIRSPRRGCSRSLPGGGGDEDQHFQETFRDFLSTRQKCGEPNDGMTYDKFAAKLRKNKEQLVAEVQLPHRALSGLREGRQGRAEGDAGQRLTR